MQSAAKDILEFWFEKTSPKLWFNPTDAFDAAIRQKFETTSVMLASKAGRMSHDWEGDFDSHFALIIALDQFPRNMYRDTPASFAWDEKALSAAQRFVDKGWDLKTDQSRRAFAFMPFMHAEDMAAQDMCVRLVDSRLNDESTLFHAKAHRKLIAQFGRFPHRNKTLGRASTAAEVQFLKNGGYRP